MRLSDLIKNGPEGEDKNPKKKTPPQAQEEESFRLSELKNLQETEEAAAPIPDLPEQTIAPEEVPLDIPDLPGLQRAARAQPPSRPPATPARPPEEELAAPSPFAPEPPAPLPERRDEKPAEMPGEKFKQRRRSVLAGPEYSALGDGSEGDSNLLDPIANNPYNPLRERSIKFVFKFLQAIANDEVVSLDEAEDIVYECVEDPDAMEHLYTLAVSVIDTSNSMAIHLFNHMVYSIKLGQGLKWPEDRLIRLGVASLIHDVGMCGISQHIRHKEGKLTSGEIAEIRVHPQYGMEIILHMYGDQFQWLAEAIYHEHERENGRGYPQGLSGGQISEYAKVIGLADVYEALTHHRPQRKRMLPHKAVQEIVQTQKVQFHQRLLKVMIEELSVFSLNSFVRLNSNAIGRVAETTPGQPLRPVVQLIFDADGNMISEERFISLKEFPLLYIVDEVEESELPSNQ